MLVKSGTITVPSSQIMENPELVTFNIPESANVCQIKYRITVKYSSTGGSGVYVTDSIWVNIQPK